MDRRSDSDDDDDDELQSLLAAALAVPADPAILQPWFDGEAGHVETDDGYGEAVILEAAPVVKPPTEAALADMAPP
eukprot:4154065-Alexandrium_andersonii.AAC.1